MKDEINATTQTITAEVLAELASPIAHIDRVLSVVTGLTTGDVLAASGEEADAVDVDDALPIPEVIYEKLGAMAAATTGDASCHSLIDPNTLLFGCSRLYARLDSEGSEHAELAGWIAAAVLQIASHLEAHEKVKRERVDPLEALLSALIGPGAGRVH